MSLSRKIDHAGLVCQLLRSKAVLLRCWGPSRSSLQKEAGLRIAFFLVVLLRERPPVWRTEKHYSNWKEETPVINIIHNSNLLWVRLRNLDPGAAQTPAVWYCEADGSRGQGATGSRWKQKFKQNETSEIWYQTQWVTASVKFVQSAI